LRGQGISQGGRILSLAEVLSALIQKPAAFNRIDIALKIMPGGHEPELVSLVNELLREGRSPVRDKVERLEDDVNANVHSVFLRIAEVLSVYDELMAKTATTSQNVRGIIDETFERFAEVQKAFASTGVTGLPTLDGVTDGDELDETRLEAQCVFNEIAWRLQKLSRELVLKAAKMHADESVALIRMAEALAGTKRAGQSADEVNQIVAEPS